MDGGEDELRWLHWTATAMATMTLIAFGYAAVAARHAPWIADLYNLVYHHSRPRRGESTGIFLFGFPAALGVGTVLVAVGRSRTAPSPLSSAGRVIFPLLWALIFFVGSLHRSSAVIAFFG